MPSCTLQDLAFLAAATPAGASYSPTYPTTVANLTTWWKADSITGLNDGDPVSTWNDSQGSNNLIGSGTARPLFKTNIFGTMPVVRFDGSNDFLSMASTLSLTHGSPYWTMLVVLAYHATPNNPAMLMGSTANNVQVQFNAAAPSSNQIVLYQNGSADVVASSGFTFTVTSARMNVIKLISGTTIAFRVNKTAAGTPSSAHVTSYGTAMDINVMGKWKSTGTEWLKGDVAEVAVYNRTLSDAECDSFYDSYAKLKYTTLP